MQFMFGNFFPPENRAVYEIMWENMVVPDMPQMAIKFGISKARTHTHTHS